MNAAWMGKAAAPTAGVIAGLALGWLLWSPAKPVPETYQPAVVQKDDSVVAERKPDPKAKPAQQLPKGAKVDRIGHAVVQPTRPGPADATPLPSLRIDWTLVDTATGKRMILSSPDGTVTEAVDIPVAAAKPVRELKHGIVAGYNPITKDALVGYSRKILGPVEAGAIVVWQDRKLGAYATVTIRW